MSIVEARAIGNALLGKFFRLEMTGYRLALFEKCTLPHFTAEVVKLQGGGQTIPVQQAGSEDISEWTSEAIVPATGEDRMFYQNLEAERRTRDVGTYYHDATLTLLGPNDEPNMIWDIQDNWLEEAEYEEFDATDGKKLLRVKAKWRCNNCVLRVQ